MAMTEFQKRCVDVINRYNLNGSISQSQIVRRLRTSNIAVSNAMQSLRRQGIANCFLDGHDQWAARYWFLTRKETGTHDETTER